MLVKAYDTDETRKGRDKGEHNLNETTTTKSPVGTGPKEPRIDTEYDGQDLTATIIATDDVLRFSIDLTSDAVAWSGKLPMVRVAKMGRWR